MGEEGIFVSLMCIEVSADFPSLSRSPHSTSSFVPSSYLSRALRMFVSASCVRMVMIAWSTTFLHIMLTNLATSHFVFTCLPALETVCTSSYTPLMLHIHGAAILLPWCTRTAAPSLSAFSFFFKVLFSLFLPHVSRPFTRDVNWDGMLCSAYFTVRTVTAT